MSKYLVLGIDNAAGEFTPAGSEKIVYNNVVLQCVNYDLPANGGGVKVDKIKIKKAQFDKVMASCGLRREDILNSVVDIFYNQYTYLEKIEVVAKMNVKFEQINKVPVK